MLRAGEQDPRAMSHPVHTHPDSNPIVIVGAGVFGISTALALLRRPLRGRKQPQARESSFISATASKSSSQSSASSVPSSILSSNPILLLDAASELPNPVGSSVDSSRIIRADYADEVYTDLAREAQEWWQNRQPLGEEEGGSQNQDKVNNGWGGERRYTRSGFVLVADDDSAEKGGEGGGGNAGQWYVEQAIKNNAMRNEKDENGSEKEKETPRLRILHDVEAIKNVTGFDGSGSGLGRSGYVNWQSGWAHAQDSVRYALNEIQRRDYNGRVTIRTGANVRRLLFHSSHYEDSATTFAFFPPTDHAKSRCTGVELATGELIKASVVILATGAWTPTLVDLRGRANATGQVLVYMDLTEAEQSAMGDKPVFMNMSRGLFVIPPRDRELKVARHGFGYQNPNKMPVPRVDHLNKDAKGGMDEKMEISVPATTIPVPAEGEKACRDLLRDIFADPALSERPFSRTRICWYCDTYVLRWPFLSAVKNRSRLRSC